MKPEMKVVAWLSPNALSVHKVPVLNGKPLITLSDANAAIQAAYEQGKKDAVPEVKLSEMRESNGNVTWSVSLAKQGDEMPWDWLQLYSDSIKGRAEYEADQLKYFFGLGPKPDILSYCTDAAPKQENKNEPV